MDSQGDTKLSKLINDVMREVDLEAPTSDFTNKVMGRIEAVRESKKLVYRPLIPKRGLFLIAALFIAIVIYAFVSFDFDNDSQWLANVEANKILNYVNWPSYDFKIPKTVSYAVFLLGAMIFIQTPILKKYFENRIA